MLSGKANVNCSHMFVMLMTEGHGPACTNAAQASSVQGAKDSSQGVEWSHIQGAKDSRRWCDSEFSLRAWVRVMEGMAAELQGEPEP